MRLTDSRVATIKPPVAGQDEHPDDLVTGLRLRVGAGGRKAWIVRARVGGKVLNKTIGAYPLMTLAKAREDARGFLIGLAKDGAPKTDHTFGELASEWIAKVAKPNNSSWKLQERRLEIHVLPHWNDRKLSLIARADVRDLIEGVEGDVNPNRALAIIRTLFRYAMSRDWIEASPAEAIAKPKADKSRDRVLSMDEVKRIYGAVDLLGFPFTGFVKMLFLTGQRRTEVASMRWADIDIDNATWTIPAEATKSNRTHMVPLSQPALDLLAETPALGEFVWTSDGLSFVSGYSKAKSRLDSFLAAKGETPQPWVLHDVRRTVATNMVRLGVLTEVVGRVLNHAATGVTAKVYALHEFAPEKRSALDRWAAELERAMSGKPTEKVVSLRATK